MKKETNSRRNAVVTHDGQFSLMTDSCHPRRSLVTHDRQWSPMTQLSPTTHNCHTRKKVRQYILVKIRTKASIINSNHHKRSLTTKLSPLFFIYFFKQQQRSWQHHQIKSMCGSGKSPSRRTPANCQLLRLQDPDVGQLVPTAISTSHPSNRQGRGQNGDSQWSTRRGQNGDRQWSTRRAKKQQIICHSRQETMTQAVPEQCKVLQTITRGQTT